MTLLLEIFLLRVGITHSLLLFYDVLGGVFLSKLEDAIFKLCADGIAQLGYELVEVKYEKDRDDFVLTFFIYNEQGISLNDCEKASAVVDEILEKEDPISNKYILSVSSLGLDRPIKDEGDFKRNIGKKIRIKLYTPKDGKKEYVGILSDFDADSFTIICDNKQSISFLKKEAGKIILELEF